MLIHMLMHVRTHMLMHVLIQVNDENVGIVPVGSIPRSTSSTPVDTIPVLANA